MPTILAVHGGAGAIRVGDEASEHARRRGLQLSLRAGQAVLARGGSALDAVTAAVTVLEDEPHFNAGRGAVLRREGSVVLDASVMRGDRAAGAVAQLCHVKNPVQLARAVLLDGSQVFRSGPGAEAWAKALGLALERAEYFVTEERAEQWRRAGGRVQLDHDGQVDSEPNDAETGSTVGAVACDEAGHLAAATSTGGVVNATPDRIGDSPVIGAGTWADDRTCAVSATGTGEHFLRAAFAHEVHAGLELGGLALKAACVRALDRVFSLGGRGGCIAVTADGQWAMPFNAKGMLRGLVCGAGEPEVFLAGDDQDFP